MNLISEINYIYSELISKNCKFNEYDFPMLEKEHFSDVIPDYIAPYNHRNSYKEKDKTSICFYMNDKLLYPRLNTINKDIEEFKKYSSILSLDISVSKNMPYNVQEYNLYQNVLYTAYLAYSGIKIIPSIRIGDEETISLLSVYKDAPIIAFSLHGCKKSTLESYDEFLFLTTINYLNPSKVLFYGRLNNKEKQIVNDLNLSYKEYDDFQKLYKGGYLC